MTEKEINQIIQTAYKRMTDATEDRAPMPSIDEARTILEALLPVAANDPSAANTINEIRTIFIEATGSDPLDDLSIGGQKASAVMPHTNMPLLQMVSRSMFGRLDMDEINRQIDACSGFVKMVCGVANNAAVMVARASCDEVRGRGHTNRPHPRCRFDVRRQFQRFFDSWHEYEMRLLYPPYNHTRFFHVADMPEATRKIYGKMTDVQYFDFWKGTGVLAHQRSEVILNSLHNKFRLSLEHHDVPYAQQVAWVMVAQSALELAVEIWNMAMRSCREVLPKEVSQKVIDDLWRDFCVRPQADEWYRAMMMLAPEINSYDLDNVEDRNIQLGLEQLRDIWISPDLPFDSTINAVKDFDRDIFRTRGEAKKAIRQLAEERNGAMGASGR